MVTLDLVQGLYFVVWALCCDSGRWHRHSVVIHVIRRVNWYTYNHSVPTRPLCFLLSVLHSADYMKHLILYYKMGFVLDFAQM